MLFSNLVRSLFWLVVLVITYLLSVSKSAARKPLYVVLGESTRTCPQSNGDVDCRGSIIPACTAGIKKQDAARDHNIAAYFLSTLDTNLNVDHAQSE